MPPTDVVRGWGQGGFERRIEVFVKIQKIKLGGGQGGGGGVGVNVNEELKFLGKWGGVLGGGGGVGNGVGVRVDVNEEFKFL